MIEVDVKVNVNEQLSKKVLDAVILGAKVGSELVVTQAKRLSPVDTGRLLTSIMANEPKIENNVVIVEVGSNVDYAIHVEYGTETQKAQPYLRPAIDLQYDNVIKTIARYMRDAL